MNRDHRNCHYSTFTQPQLQDQSPYISFMPAATNKPLPKSSLNDGITTNRPARNYTTLLVDDSISFAAQLSPQKTPVSQKNLFPAKLPPKMHEKTPSTYHNSQSGKSVNESVSNSIHKTRKLENSRQSGQIYEQIIKILQLENTNLKNQNRYMLTEHKKLVNENHKLKQEVQSLKGYSGLKLQFDKLQEINQTYQRLVEELKYILMEEMVAIHQKINFIMSSQDAANVYNQFEASLKRSTSLLNTQGLDLAGKDKEKRGQRLVEGDNLQEMLSLLEYGQGKDEKMDKMDRMATFETFESINNLKGLGESGCGKSVCDSPTQATFY